MSDTYTKLFSSITESTVWGESYSTRIVWVTMLAMADARGNVYGAIPGLARRANVTLQETEAALAAFLAPDPYSRTRDEDGRRIEVIDGGWQLINHAKYGAVRNAEERAEYKREWDRQNRPSGHQRAKEASKESDTSPTPVRLSPANPTAPTPSALTPSLTEKPKQEQASPSGSRLPADWRLPDEWRVWAEAERPGVSIQDEADKFADYWHGVAGAKGRKADWQATWRNWIRNSRAVGNARAGPAPSAPGKTMQALMALEEMKNGLVDPRAADRIPEAALPRIGSYASR